MTDVAEPVPTARSAETMGVRKEMDAVDDAFVLFPLVLRVPDSLPMDEEQFLAFCRQNEPWRMERNAEGDLIIMPPAGDDAPIQNSELTYQLTHWAKQDGTGRPFDSSGGFTLPNGAIRSPAAAWVPRERLAALTAEPKKRFPHLCPDFEVELRSSTDRLCDLRAKMKEYLANGARLGWLIDPKRRRIEVYRPDRPVEQLDDPATVSGEPVLPGFVMDAQAVFDMGY
jgi:Uma2 family endonuclease